MRNPLLILLLLGATAVAGCSPEDRKADSARTLSGKLRVVGSSTMAPVVAEIAKNFHAAHPAVQIDVQSGGSGRGISEARSGAADIGMASRALTDKERDLVGFSIARDGVGLLVHKSNPVESLTNEQVTAIFTGRTANWKAVGGQDAAITVVTRDQGRSVLDLVTQYFSIKAAEIKAASSAGENAAAIKAVVDDRNAIVMMSVGEAERQAAAGVPIKQLPIDGVAATTANIRAGKYPLSRSLTLVTKALPTGLAKAFIDYSLLPQQAAIIRRADFVPYVD